MTLDPVDVQVGANIKMVRQQRGITQKVLGHALGLTFQQVQKYETGRNRVGASRLQRIADILDVKPAQLFPPQARVNEHADIDYEQLMDMVHAAYTVEGRDLIDSFIRIRSAELRRAIVALVEAIADRTF
ncbi:helix-turn-helix domain-containing protein [Rhodopseudomonas parapalustris]